MGRCLILAEKLHFNSVANAFSHLMATGAAHRTSGKGDLVTLSYLMQADFHAHIDEHLGSQEC